MANIAFHQTRAARLLGDVYDYDVGSPSNIGDLSLDDLDTPSEVLSFAYQILVSSLVVILGIPFSPTLSLSHYEAVDGVTIGSRWLVGVLFLIITFISVIVFLYMKGEHPKVALIRTTTATITFFIFGMIGNSLWEHGVLLWDGYYTSIHLFFVSDVLVTIIFGLVSMGIVGIIPTKKIKPRVDFKAEHCNDEGTCTVPLNDHKQLLLKIEREVQL